MSIPADRGRTARWSRVTVWRAAGAAVLAGGLIAAAASFIWGGDFADASPVTTPVATTSTDSADAGNVYIIDGTIPVVRPGAFTLSAADQGNGLQQVTWSAWGGAVAEGAATYVENNCVPDCAQGTYTSYPVTIKAENLQQADGTGYYRKVVVDFAGRHPAWVTHGEAGFSLAGGVPQ